MVMVMVMAMVMAMGLALALALAGRTQKLGRRSKVPTSGSRATLRYLLQYCVRTPYLLRTW